MWEQQRHAFYIKAGHTDVTLMVASSKAKSAFLKLIVDPYVSDPEKDIEMWYEFSRSMAKDD